MMKFPEYSNKVHNILKEKGFEALANFYHGKIEQDFKIPTFRTATTFIDWMHTNINRAYRMDIEPEEIADIIYVTYTEHMMEIFPIETKH